MRIEEMPGLGAGYVASIEGTVTAPSPKSDAKSERRRGEMFSVQATIKVKDIKEAIPDFEFGKKPRAKWVQISEQIAAACAKEKL